MIEDPRVISLDINLISSITSTIGAISPPGFDESHKLPEAIFDGGFEIGLKF